jgi:hypothetical protein
MKNKDGKYLKVCGFDLCGKDFFGRLNRDYCAPKCKKLQNNGKTKLVNQEAKGSDLKIRKAIRILIDIFKPDKDGKFIINWVDLDSKSFPFDLPTIKIKDDRYNGTMSGVGSYCFYREEENFIFYKI